VTIEHHWRNGASGPCGGRVLYTIEGVGHASENIEWEGSHFGGGSKSTAGDNALSSKGGRRTGRRTSLEVEEGDEKTTHQGNGTGASNLEEATNPTSGGGKERVTRFLNRTWGVLEG